jgi:hypothetical protein
LESGAAPSATATNTTSDIATRRFIFTLVSFAKKMNFPKEVCRKKIFFKETSS